MRPFYQSLAFAYDIGLMRTFVVDVNQCVPCFGAKMRYVDDGCGIIGVYTQCFAMCQCGQPFSGLQDRERAEQTECVEFMFHDISLA